MVRTLSASNHLPERAEGTCERGSGGRHLPVPAPPTQATAPRLALHRRPFCSTTRRAHTCFQLTTGRLPICLLFAYISKRSFSHKPMSGDLIRTFLDSAMYAREPQALPAPKSFPRKLSIAFSVQEGYPGPKHPPTSSIYMQDDKTDKHS